MTQQIRQEVLQILRGNICDGFVEAQPARQGLPQQAIETATSESLQAFLDIHEGLSRIVDSSRMRTRYTGVRSSTGGYGIAYYRDPITGSTTNRTNREIQAVLLPTKPNWYGALEMYFSGHSRPPVPADDVESEGTREGHPVFRVRSTPSRRLVSQSISALSNSAIY